MRTTLFSSRSIIISLHALIVIFLPILAIGDIVFEKRVLFDLNVPAEAEEYNSPSSGPANQPQPPAAAAATTSSPPRPTLITESNKRKRVFKTPESARKAHKKFRDQFGVEAFQKAKSTMTGEEFKKYSKKHEVYWKNRKQANEKQKEGRKQASKHFQQGIATEKELHWKVIEKAKNQRAYERRKRLGQLTPSELKKKKEKAGKLRNEKSDKATHDH